MVFKPDNCINKVGRFYLDENVSAVAHKSVCRAEVLEFFSRCAFTLCKLDATECDELVFRIGNNDGIEVGDCDYTISVNKSGACVRANTEKDLIRGVVTLAQRVETDDERIKIDCCEIRDNSKIKVRMAHFCIFASTKLYELERFVRFCGALKYTHVVLEFWGMLRYDCMKELGWGHAFTKDQIRPIIEIARSFGIEIIPMFNHWGHASASRGMHGKHVVLNQNPSLQHYFSDTGWCWNYDNPKTRDLLKKVRAELIDLCGEGEYFHIGCDEAYGFDFSEKSMSGFCEYLNEIADDLKSRGRRAIAWGDMFIARHPEFNKDNRYTCNCKSEKEEEFFLSNLDKSIIIADWQYDSPVYPVQTSEVFKNAGFDVIICPWDRGESESIASVKTARDGLWGVMHTTWHTLSSGYVFLTLVAQLCWQNNVINDRAELCTNTASVLRKAYFTDGDYEKSGWSEREIVERT
ncbi:MAG: family 20 glycosylhydrolase [Clostridia bacterium]|nr:family 20 glycosylhydrolase [Clostridia bacterium]